MNVFFYEERTYGQKPPQKGGNVGVEKGAVLQPKRQRARGGEQCRV